MTLIERLRTAMKDTTSRAIHPLLVDILDQMVVDDSLAKSLAEAFHAAHTDLEKLKVSGSRVRDMNRFFLAAAAICKVHGYGFVETDRSKPAANEPGVCGCGGMMIHYDKMDLKKPPKGVELVECPNCHLPAKRVPKTKSDIYVHSEDVLDSGTRMRHRCEPFHNGDLEVTMPVLPGKKEDEKEDP